jgi:iron complex outermembrane recepter protein
MIKPARLHLLISLLLLITFNGRSQNLEDSLQYSLSIDTTILLNEVSVEAYKVVGRLHTIPGSLSVLTGADLNISNGTSFANILNTLPGVTMQAGTQATSRIVIRGMGSRTPYNTNRIRAYLNEIPLTTSDGVSTPEEIDMQSLGQMEIIKGPASALYGSGLGGSINLYTPAKLLNEGKVDVQYESFNTLKTHLSGTLNSGKTNIWGSLGHYQSDGYRENNEYRRTSFLTTIKWKQPKWSLNTTLLMINVDGGIPSSVGKTLFEENPRAAAANWKAVEGYKKYIKGIGAVTLTNSLSGKLSNQFTIFGKINDNYEKRPFNNLDDQSLGGGFRNKLNYHTDKTDLIAGMEWLSESYEWKLDLDQNLLNRNRENRIHLNLFAMMYYRPVPKLNISLAGSLNNISYRLKDLYSLNGDQSGTRKFPVIISPRLGVNYAPGDNFALYASAGHGFSLPSPDETLLPAGDINPDIKPEQGYQYEFGSRLNLFNKRLEIDGTLYWIELNNLLLTKRVTEDIFTGINAGKTRHQGFELLLRSIVFDLAGFPGKLTSIFSYTASLNRFIDFTDDDNIYDGNNLPGIPGQTLQSILKWYPVKMLELITHFQYSGDQYLNDSNSIKYPGYFLENIKLTAMFRQKEKTRINIYAGINNLTDEKYASMLIVNALGFGSSEPRYYYPGLPRHFYGGVQFQF